MKSTLMIVSNASKKSKTKASLHDGVWEEQSLYCHPALDMAVPRLRSQPQALAGDLVGVALDRDRDSRPNDQGRERGIEHFLCDVVGMNDQKVDTYRACVCERPVRRS